MASATGAVGRNGAVGRAGAATGVALGLATGGAGDVEGVAGRVLVLRRCAAAGYAVGINSKNAINKTFNNLIANRVFWLGKCRLTEARNLG